MTLIQEDGEIGDTNLKDRKSEAPPLLDVSFGVVNLKKPELEVI